LEIPGDKKKEAEGMTPQSVWHFVCTAPKENYLRVLKDLFYRAKMNTLVPYEHHLLIVGGWRT